MGKGKQVPSIGRVVHYVRDNGHHRPAVIVRVWDETKGLVNLQVFNDGDGSTSNDKAPNVEWVCSRFHSDDPTPGTWHWPEYVPTVEE